MVITLYVCVKEKITLTVGAFDISTCYSSNVLSLILRFLDDTFSTFKFLLTFIVVSRY